MSFEQLRVPGLALGAIVVVATGFWLTGRAAGAARRPDYRAQSAGRSRMFSIPLTRQWSSTRFILSRTSNTLPE